MKVTIDLIGDQELLKELEQEIDQLNNFVAAEFKRQVVPRTPIDKGTARRGWQQRQSGRGQTVENRVPYIERLERGYSRQARNGFVNQAIAATVAQTRRIIK